MFCGKCGNEIDDRMKFCPNCGQGKENSDLYNQTSQYNQGYQQSMYGTMPERKSRMAAGLLQIFLGGFGVGRFYLGYTGIGVAQLLVTLFTCGVGAIWPFVDGILILCGHVQTDADDVPLRD